MGPSSSCACQTCGLGTFVPVPGAARNSDCQRCPLGTDPSTTAGYRACPCLPGHFRRSRFGRCESCSGEEGVVCSNDTRQLQPGYWWTFANDTARESYGAFVEQLGLEAAETLAAHSGSFPQPYACLSTAACPGGQQSACGTGYSGVLCSECVSGYYGWLGTCHSCPAFATAVVAAVFIVAIFLALSLYLLHHNFLAVKQNFYASHRPSVSSVSSRQLQLLSSASRAIVNKTKVRFFSFLIVIKTREPRSCIVCFCGLCVLF
jgi:hypothetical protein